LEAAQKVNKSYQEIGTPKEIETAFAEAQKLITDYRKHGSPVQITRALESAFEVITNYRKLGTPKQIDTVLEKFRGIARDQMKVIEAKKIADLAKELGVTEAKIKSLWGKMPEAEMREFFKDIVPVKPVVVAPVKTTETAAIKNRFTKTDEKKVTETVVEDKRLPWERKPVGESLMGHFMKNDGQDTN
jgi:hypothetical protein